MNVTKLHSRHRVEVELTASGSYLMVACYLDSPDIQDWNEGEVLVIPTGNDAMDALINLGLRTTPLFEELLEIAADSLRLGLSEASVSVHEAIRGNRMEQRCIEACTDPESLQWAHNQEIQND